MTADPHIEQGCGLDHLFAVAQAADEGGRPWEWQGGYPQSVLRVGDVVVVADVFESPDAPSRFADFIATFDPPTVLSLLALAARLEAAERDLACLRAIKEAAEWVHIYSQEDVGTTPWRVSHEKLAAALAAAQQPPAEESA